MKFLKLTSFGVLFLALLLTACNKEAEQIVPSQSNNLTKDNVVLNDLSSESVSEAGDIVGRYIHNGVEIDPSTLDWEDSNTEMFYNFGTDEDVILVFTNEEEVTAWIATLSEEQANVINKERAFRQDAIQIANDTGIEEYYAQNGTTSTEYDETMELLRIRIYGSNGSQRGLGFLWDNTNFGGVSSPIIGLGIGKPVLGTLDKQVGSTKALSATATYGYNTRMFYLGSSLNVNCWFHSATISSGTLNVGNACGFASGLSYVSFDDFGALRLWNNKARSFFPAFL